MGNTQSKMENGFVDVKGYEELYKMNIMGDVWSVKRGKCLKTVVNRGYKRICLCKDGIRKNKLIHRLIMLHFIPNPHNLPCIDHINRVKYDNRIENLKWSSHSDNSRNNKRVDERRGGIQKRTYKRKDGSSSITYKLRYVLPGEYGRKNTKSKSFKTLEDLEAFRQQIYC